MNLFTKTECGNRKQTQKINTRIFGQCPWKNPEGKTSREREILLFLELKENDLLQQFIPATKTQTYLDNHAKQHLKNCAQTAPRILCPEFCTVYNCYNNKCCTKLPRNLCTDLL
jgi:hypothetical protein